MQTTLSATNDVYCAAIQKQHNYDTGLRIWPKQCQGEPPVKYQRSLCSIMIVPNPDRCSYCSFHFFRFEWWMQNKITGIYGHWKHHNPVSIQVSSCDGNVAKTGSLRSVMQWLLCCQLAARKARIKVRCSGDATNKLVSQQVLYPTGDFFPSLSWLQLSQRKCTMIPRNHRLCNTTTARHLNSSHRYFRYTQY